LRDPNPARVAYGRRAPILMARLPRRVGLSRERALISAMKSGAIAAARTLDGGDRIAPPVGDAVQSRSYGATVTASAGFGSRMIVRQPA
jgi:hypothetical protein